MDNILDHVVVQGQRYDIVSPTAFGDYIETIGSACINPDGYAQGSTFLARLGNEQFYYEATAAITQGSAILEGTNCKKTTVTGREAELASEIETLGETVDSLNEALSNEVEARATLGAHNLLPNIARLETKNGVSFYPNTDGSISLSGTASGAAVFNSIEFKFTAPTGQYKFTGGIDDDVYFAILNITDGGTMAYDQGNGATLSLTKGKTYRFQFCVVSGKDTSGIVIYPMIRLASDTDPTYQPYAMTNRELTDSKANKSDLASISIIGTTNNTGNTIPAGTYFYLNGTLVRAKNTDIANNATLTLNTNYEVVTAGALNDLLNNIYTVIDTMPTTENTDKAVSGCPLGYILIGADVYNSSLSRWDSLPIGIFSDRPAYMTSYTDSSYTYARVYLKAGGGTAYGGQTFRAKFIKV